ncbi:MAG: sulfite exporter TauE/SafE family protein, partial [Halobacteriales archaeon]|nr:sulfite exporter TauE/SafE family protein [Halobacteriales archaeon]
QSGGVDLSIVAPLLAGSALGARIGSATTSIVDEEEIKVYFGVMLLGGAIAVAFRQIGQAYGIEVLTTVSFLLIIGAALLVSGAVVYSGIRNVRREAEEASASPAD